MIVVVCLNIDIIVVVLVVGSDVLQSAPPGAPGSCCVSPSCRTGFPPAAAANSRVAGPSRQLQFEILRRKNHL